MKFDIIKRGNDRNQLQRLYDKDLCLNNKYQVYKEYVDK